VIPANRLSGLELGTGEPARFPDGREFCDVVRDAAGRPLAWRPEGLVRHGRLEDDMKIGVAAFLTEKSGNPGTIAAEAERAGFESFWVAEHLVIPAVYTTYYQRSPDGKVPESYAHLADPFVALAMAAQATSRIRIGTSVCLLPERNPIETAKAAATLDMYSGGRLMLGVGAGWFPEEAAIMGVDFKRRWRHLRESVEAMRELWSKPEASYEGEIIKFPPVRLFPKPVQKPYPPIFLGAHDPGHALKRVARWADGWMPGGLSPEQAEECIPQVKRMARENGRDPERMEFSVMLGIGAQQTPSPDALKRYAAAGISRVIILAAEMAGRDGVEVVKGLAPLVERAAQV
jgi:probable F420-dependent oxidoreductase